MEDAPDGLIAERAPRLPTRFAYGLASRLWAAGVTAVVSVPLAYVLVFLLRNMPAVEELGPILLVLLFLMAPPLFAVLRYGDAFRRFEVQSHQLVVLPPFRSWSIRWRDISRVVRRSSGAGAGQPFKLSVEVKLDNGKSAWVALFDSSLPGAEDFYAQIVAHTPHIRPKELVDEPRWFWRRS